MEQKSFYEGVQRGHLRVSNLLTTRESGQSYDRTREAHRLRGVDGARSRLRDLQTSRQALPSSYVTRSGDKRALHYTFNYLFYGHVREYSNTLKRKNQYVNCINVSGNTV